MGAHYLIGVDLGTTQTKIGLFDLQGQLIHLAQQGYSVYTGDGPGCAEQKPQDWWAAICVMLRELTQRVAGEDIAAICVGGQGPTTVLANAEGQPLCNAVLWMDTRATAEREALEASLGEPISPYAHVPTAMWMRSRFPEAYAAAAWYLTAFDFAAFRLSGRAVASTFGGRHPFPQEHLEAGRLRPELSPPAVGIGEPIGEVTTTASAETGLPAGIMVIAGVNDGIETVIGTRLTKVGQALDSGGTAGGFALCWSELLEAEGIYSWPGIIPGQSIIGGTMNALGKAMDWYLETFENSAISHDQLIERTLQISPGAEGLIFLPYLAGERSPIWDPAARGVFFGLSLKHNRDHLARAIVESTAFAVRHVTEPIQLAGGVVSEMMVTGRQARNDSLSQLKADVLGFPVAVPAVTEAALLGAAVLSGVGAGVFPDIASGSERMVRTRVVIKPNAQRYEFYSNIYAVYKRLYPDLREAFAELSVLNKKNANGL